MSPFSPDLILDELERRNVVPIPRWHFLLRRSVFWILAVISVVTGSLAMATAIYVFLDQDFVVDHENIARFLAQQPLVDNIIVSIPYLWLTALILFILVAYYGFRHTRKGYRYPMVSVIGGSLLLSLLLSGVMNVFDVGKILHRYLVENVGGYDSLVYANEQRWSQARKGWLGGKVVREVKTMQLLVVMDYKKRLWTIDMSDAELTPGTMITPGKYLKITGATTGTLTFRASTVQPWEKRYQKHTRMLKKEQIVVPHRKSQDTTYSL
ncbi:MAG: hypothetical protein HGB29_04050 [Chlorobiaceae bacterium]|nr:hypothetical protein [Chlorobiaceae bacterium]NTW74015.1 hypothetical protein [Chlorobiaceae bacterium]